MMINGVKSHTEVEEDKKSHFRPSMERKSSCELTVGLFQSNGRNSICTKFDCDDRDLLQLTTQVARSELDLI